MTQKLFKLFLKREISYATYALTTWKGNSMVSRVLDIFNPEREIQ